MQETSNDGMGKRQTVTIGREHFSVRPWHADPHVAYLTSRPANSSPDPGTLRSVLSKIEEVGYTAVITSALHFSEIDSFIRAGFTEYDRLTVLAHDMSQMDPSRRTPPDSMNLRAARKRDRAAALELDGRAFPQFWRLDEEGLDEALSATTRTRFRVAEIDGRIVGYSVTGRAMRQCFLQRLATDPDVAGAGIGSALVVDALQWGRRRHAKCVLVNTQRTNERALSVYRRLGFRITPTSLLVMTRALP
ncbi:MAG: GNAT family N-acetyltransferase [Microthrixaceae bacterium]